MGSYRSWWMTQMLFWFVPISIVEFGLMWTSDWMSWCSAVSGQWSESGSNHQSFTHYLTCCYGMELNYWIKRFWAWEIRFTNSFTTCSCMSHFEFVKGHLLRHLSLWMCNVQVWNCVAVPQNLRSKHSSFQFVCTILLWWRGVNFRTWQNYTASVCTKRFLYTCKIFFAHLQKFATHLQT